MRKVVSLVVFLSFALGSFAQTFTGSGVGTSMVGSWTAGAGNSTSATYNMYKLVGACPATAPAVSTMTKVNSTAIAALTYTDSGLTPGVYCYEVTAVDGGTESGPSNMVQTTIQPPPPTLSTATVSGKNATLGWSTVTGANYNVYRLSGGCPSTLPPLSSWAKLTSNLSSVGYMDTVPSNGSYCYAVTSVINNVESPVSNPLPEVFTPSAPGSFTEIIK